MTPVWCTHWSKNQPRFLPLTRSADPPHRAFVHVLERPTRVVVVQEIDEQRVTQRVAQLAVHHLCARVDHVVVDGKVTEVLRRGADGFCVAAQIRLGLVEGRRPRIGGAPCATRARHSLSSSSAARPGARGRIPAE